MAYRRTANLPGTQRYALTRRKQRTIEEFDFNPNLSRPKRRSINPPASSPAVQGSGVSEAGGPSSIAVPGLEAEPVESAEPIGDPTESPMTEAQKEAWSETLSDFGRSLIGKGVEGSILGQIFGNVAKGALKGITAPFTSPLAFVRALYNLQKKYRENLEMSEIANPLVPTTAPVYTLDPKTNPDDPTSISMGPLISGPYSLDPKTNPDDITSISMTDPDPADPTGPGPSVTGENPADALGVGFGDPTPPGDEGISPSTSTGPTVESGDPPGGDPTVLCTALYNMGLLDNKIYKADSEYAGKYIDALTYAGYAVWARHLAKSKWAVLLLSPLIKSFAKEMYFRLHGGRGNFVGRVIMNWGSPVCKLIGKIMEIVNGDNIRRISGTTRS